MCIEHIGSTSVAGLAAMPINDIDIVLVVETFAAKDYYLGDLEAAGFILRIQEPVKDHDSSFRGVEPHRVFKGPEIDLNLHVLSRDSAEIDRHRSLRDWLRSHPDDRAMYERMKLELAAQHWDNVQQYADARTVVIDEIRAKSDRSRYPNCPMSVRTGPRVEQGRKSRCPQPRPEATFPQYESNGSMDTWSRS